MDFALTDEQEQLRSAVHALMQKAAPEEGAEPTQEFVVKTFESVQQEAEQALTKEEIPPAAKEYVRQYFGTLEPEESGPR